jgi:hypothetical protein
MSNPLLQAGLQRISMGQNIHLNISQNMNPATVVQQGPLSMTGKFTVAPQSTTMITPSTPGAINVNPVMNVIPSGNQPPVQGNRGATPTIYNWITVTAKPNQPQPPSQQ